MKYELNVFKSTLIETIINHNSNILFKSALIQPFLIHQ